MSLLIENINNRWHQLQSRQRRNLIYSASIIFILFLCLLLSPLYHYYQSSKQYHQKLVASYQWLAEQPLLSTSAPSTCRYLSIIENSAELQQKLNQQLADKQIQNPVWKESTDGLLLDLKEVDGQHLLSWLEQASCQGLRLKTIVLEKQTSERLNANIEVVLL